MTVTAGEPTEARALAAIAGTRTRGMHFLGHFVGITGRPAPAGTARLTLAAPAGPAGTDGRERQLPLLAFSVFADLVLMSSIRSHVGAGARLGTVTLSIQHRRATVPGLPVLGVAQAPAPADGYGIAAGTFTCGGEVVGQAHASAMALPAPPGRTPQLLPWERDPLPPAPAPLPGDLEPDEALFLANVQKAQARAASAGTPVEDELLEFTWAPSHPEGVHGELAIGPELSNRVGHLQGGALYAVAARAAARALAGGNWDLAEGTYQFLRPGEGQVLTATASALRRGRSLAFVQARLSVDGVLIGAGSFAFRARP